MTTDKRRVSVVLTLTLHETVTEAELRAAVSNLEIDDTGIVVETIDIGEIDGRPS